ncbi:MAG: hypothetical protein Kow0027_22090 [Saprospiraceae bacterium]
MNLTSFRQRFKELPPLERDILKIMAIACEPLDTGLLVRLLRRCQIFGPRGELITSKHLEAPRQVLDDAGWLDYSAGEQWALRYNYLHLVLRMAVIDLWYKTVLQMLRSELPFVVQPGQPPRNFGVCLRELSAALYAGDMERMDEVSRAARRYFHTQWQHTDLLATVFGPFDPEWLGTFHRDVQVFILNRFIEEAVEQLESTEEYEAVAQTAGFSAVKDCPGLAAARCLQGKAKEVLIELQGQPLSKEMAPMEGLARFFNGQLHAALAAFTEGSKYSGVLTQAEADFKGVLLILTLFGLYGDKAAGKVLPLLPKEPNPAFGKIFDYLKGAALVQQNRLTEAEPLLNELPALPLEWYFFGLANFWSMISLGNFEKEKIKNIGRQAEKNGYSWLSRQIKDLLAATEAQALAGTSPNTPVGEEITGKKMPWWLPRKPYWQRALDAILEIAPEPEDSAATARMKRLAWQVDFEEQVVQPVEQVLGKNGWSKGRQISLKRLKTGEVDSLTKQDLEIAKAISVMGDSGVNAGYTLDFNKVLPALAGHPLLFLHKQPDVPVELVKEELQLRIDETGEGFVIHFSHPLENDGLTIIRETPTRYLLLQPTPAQQRIFQLMSGGQISLPKEAKSQLLKIVRHISPMVVIHTDVDDIAGKVETIEGNATPHIHLLPAGDGFKLEIFVKPFTEEPPYAKPGKGHTVLFTKINGLTTKAIRNLEAEEENARQVEEACPTLSEFPSENREWIFEQPELALQALLELEPLHKEGKIVMEYPKGQQLQLKGQLDMSRLRLGIQSRNNWFEVEGGVQLDENEVLDLKNLLALSRQNSRFVKLNDGQFVALTAQLQQKLQDLDALLSDMDNALAIHPLAVGVFDDFAEGLSELKADAAWKEQLQKLHELENFRAEPPENFTAELRQYQQEGYQWLMRLAHWGVGACLADDMGLGKTVQTLAVLSKRAESGPALVVAPASVVRNWYHEARRFAPGLEPIIFGENDRTETLRELKAGDLLLCSYGLMQQEQERLTKIEFSTIVLDEAQAIKNRATKRSKAAMQLKAGFRIITTGTPIENHLGELWNLFRFLNPGLLGSLEVFTEKYALPIERDNDHARREQLRRLLRPFILRRKKDDVLKELPPKTEVTLEVELSPEERVFYEALRRQALENIHSSEGGFNQKRFQILAELMRLRQAACHPRLVKADSKLQSSKLQLFGEIVEELIEEGHKALVFSQFVSHLHIIENWVKSRGIKYQYLDGSTPLPQRDRAIREFQSGEGDLFLISLRAGGFGLNLTAADYVIHMDPWWNPAVEDQASDRAHRIGQERPVTIYRLVSSGTIEEKIVRLHAEKRELADSLLEGTEAAARLNVEELVALLEG